MQGQDPEAVEALRQSRTDAPGISPAERALLCLVKLLTQEPHRCGADEIQQVREHGWTDPQIAEAVYITALFAFFNRVADAFGLEEPRYDLLAPPASNPPLGSSDSTPTPAPGDDTRLGLGRE